MGTQCPIAGDANALRDLWVRTLSSQQCRLRHITLALVKSPTERMLIYSFVCLALETKHHRPNWYSVYRCQMYAVEQFSHVCFDSVNLVSLYILLSPYLISVWIFTGSNICISYASKAVIWHFDTILLLAYILIGPFSLADLHQNQLSLAVLILLFSLFHLYAIAKKFEFRERTRLFKVIDLRPNELPYATFHYCLRNCSAPQRLYKISQNLAAFSSYESVLVEIPTSNAGYSISTASFGVKPRIHDHGGFLATENVNDHRTVR